MSPRIDQGRPTGLRIALRWALGPRSGVRVGPRRVCRPPARGFAGSIVGSARRLLRAMGNPPSISSCGTGKRSAAAARPSPAWSSATGRRSGSCCCARPCTSATPTRRADRGRGRPAGAAGGRLPRGNREKPPRPLAQAARPWLRRAAPTPWPARGRTSTTITTSATTSTGSGSTSEMVYTCAYFPAPATTLEEAQRAKMDLVCRKLWLRPGETVVEAGCGWGALALYMARHYGVTRQGLQHLPRADPARPAAGPRRGARRPRRVHRGRLPQHSRAVRRLRLHRHAGARRARPLRRVGRSDRPLPQPRRPGPDPLHRPRPAGPDQSLDRAADFPRRLSAQPPRDVRTCWSPAAFSVLDVENLRLHYAETLRHWLARFEAGDRRDRADVRRGVRPRVAAVPDRLDGRVSPLARCNCSRSCSPGPG